MTERKRTISNELAATLILAGPVVFTQLAQTSLGFIDTIMVGRLGPDALAGVSLGNSIFFGTVVFGMGIMTAVTPMVSQAYGARDYDMVGRSTRQGLWMGLIIGLLSMLIVRNASPVLLLLGLEPDMVALSRAYLHAISWGIPPFLWFVVLRGLVEGTSKPLPATAITWAGVLLNVGANYVLMYGKLGFPALGLEGTGWASSIVFWFTFLLLMLYCTRAANVSALLQLVRLRTPDVTVFREMFRIGWPIGASFFLEAGLFMITAILMGLFSTTAMAAHQVAIQCAAFTFMVPLGVGIAASVRVGQAVGRGDAPGVRRAGVAGIGLAATFMFGTAMVFWLWPRTIVGLYLDLDMPQNQEVIRLAVVLLGVAAVFQIFDGVQVAAAGALRGLKDTRAPMVIGFISYWLFGLSTSWVLGFELEKGPQGLWWGLVTGLVVASSLLTVRFYRRSADGTAFPLAVESGSANATA